MRTSIFDICISAIIAVIIRYPQIGNDLILKIILTDLYFNKCAKIDIAGR
jgi:hypothetical protein